MATPLQVTKRLCITPLVEITDPIFARFYGHGLYWSLYGSEIPGLLDDTYLFNMLKSYMHCVSPDEPHELFIVWHSAFALGMVHGGVLRRRDGTLRPEVSTLVTLTNQECRRGYLAGREYYFLDAENAQERIRTDRQIVEELCELAEGYPHYGDDADNVLRFALGGIAGVMSGQLFPWTQTEHEAWEQDSISRVGYVCTIPDTCLAAGLFVAVTN